MNRNQFGKTSRLQFSSVYKDGETVIEDVAFTAPFKIMKPFHLSKNHVQIMLLTASAGIMEGDTQEFRLNIGENTNVEFTSQAYEKIHKMESGSSCRNTHINIEKNGFLYYNALPTIPFAESAFENKVIVELQDETSKFIMCEILSCGRAARGEVFQYRYYRNLVTVYENKRIIYRDNSRYEPQWMPMSELGMYEGYTHLANVFICNMDSGAYVNYIHELLEKTKDIEGAVSYSGYGDLVVRILGRSAQKLSNVCEEIYRNISRDIS